MKRILIINEYDECGGAEVIEAYQRNILSKHYSVHELFFQRRANECRANATYLYSKPIYRYLYDFVLARKLKRYLNSVKPDLIIVHNIVSSPFTVYRAIKDYKSIQMIHDYGICCPTTQRVYLCEDSICAGANLRRCIKKCRSYHGRLWIIIKYLQILLLRQIKKKVINTFVSPSKHLALWLMKYGINAVVLNNPIEVNNEHVHNKPKYSRKVFCYAGGIHKNKGIFRICEYICNRNDLDIYLNVYGSLGTKEENDTFNDYITRSHAHINYKGVFPHSELINEISKHYYLLVPSRWVENYPTIILEAFSVGTLVIGSDRGGIPELVGENRGLIFNYENGNSFEHTLRTALSLSEQEYKKLADNAYSYAQNNNSSELYERKLSELVEQLTQSVDK